MRLRHVLMCFAACAVTGCNAVLPSGDDVDPLADVERLSDVDVADDAQSVSIAATESGGFFAGLLGGNRETPDSETTPETASAPQRGGLFGFLGGGTSDATTPDAAATIDPDQVAPLTMQAFGEVGKTCGLSRGDLGTKIATVSGYDIYDTFPNSTTARPHYITGFNDRCARQFTAALVLTGDVGTHEIVRYQGSGRNLPYTAADEGYEQIKRSFCGASRGQPCGGRLDALARRTTFVTAYETFASSPVWADILLHNGEFVAASVETRN